MFDRPNHQVNKVQNGFWWRGSGDHFLLGEGTFKNLGLIFSDLISFVRKLSPRWVVVNLWRHKGNVYHPILISYVTHRFTIPYVLTVYHPYQSRLSNHVLISSIYFAWLCTATRLSESWHWAQRYRRCLLRRLPWDSGRIQTKQVPGFCWANNKAK